MKKIETQVKASSDVLTSFLITTARSLFPFLNLPIISQLFNIVIGKTMEKIEGSAEIFLKFKNIDSMVDKDVKDYKNSLNKNQKAVHAGKNPDEINKLKAQHLENMRRLISLK